MDSFNYSIYDFIYLSTVGVKKEEIAQKISQLMTAFLLKNPQVGYTAELVQLIFYMLCLSSEPVAYLILTEIFS